MPNWRDLVPGETPAIPTPPTAGVPAPTPHWRDLGQADDTPAAEAPAPVPAAPAVPSPAPGPWAPGTVAGDQADPSQAWQHAEKLGASPLTPQHTAPAPAAPADPRDASAALGMQLAGAGAAATEVDPDSLLRMIRSLQAQVTQLTQAQTAAGAPDVVKYATALADHLQAKADAHPVINADPDHTFIPVLQKAAQLVNAAEQTAATGAGHESLITLAKDAGYWIAAHARRFPAIDYDYLLQLAEEVGSAAAKLLA